METQQALPVNVLYELARLQEATRFMPGLATEIDFLQQRLERGDMSATHLAIRKSAEALLRHALQVEDPARGGSSRDTIEALEGALRPKVKGRVDAAFWNHLDSVRAFGNRHAHFHLDDVYHASEIRRADPWAEVSLCVGHLASMVTEFSVHWPPPATAMTRARKPETTARPTPASTRPGSQPVSSERKDLRAVSVKQARESNEIRKTLESLTGLSRSAITRRLRTADGRAKLRNIFPEPLGASDKTQRIRERNAARRAETMKALDEMVDAMPLEEALAELDKVDDLLETLDYEAIGNLTIAQARSREIAGDIARLTGTTESSVKRKLTRLNGHGVVRRQFSWYEGTTIGGLTVRIAIDYGMVPLLARVFGKRDAAIAAKLRRTSGQTKLRTIFPELDT